MKTIFSHPAVHGKEYHPFQTRSLSISVQVYVTGRDGEESAGEKVWPDAPPGVDMSMSFGRPCFGHIVNFEKERQIGAMAVSVCGKGSMGDAVRQAVREAQGKKKVELYEETFSW